MADLRAAAHHSLDHGAQFPYDAPDAWWEMAEPKPLPATDWAHAAARGILADLTDRRGIKWSLQEIDEEVRAELVASLAEIIRAALAQAEPVQEPVAFDTAHAMRLADEYADLAADVRAAQGYPEHALAQDRKLMNEFRAALEAYLSRQVEPERNFCPRCGKRLHGEGIHTCTPPQQAEPVTDPFNCPRCGRHDYGLHGRKCLTCDAPQQDKPVQQRIESLAQRLRAKGYEAEKSGSAVENIKESGNG